MKKLNIGPLSLRSKVMRELRQLKDLRHENLNPFLGIFIDPKAPALIYEYGQRGSLEVCFFFSFEQKAAWWIEMRNSFEDDEITFNYSWERTLTDWRIVIFTTAVTRNIHVWSVTVFPLVFSILLTKNSRKTKTLRFFRTFWRKKKLNSTGISNGRCSTISFGFVLIL